MKKLYLLLFLGFALNSYGQAQPTYDIVIAYERQPTDDKNQEFYNNYSVSNEYLGFCLTDYQGNVISIKSSDNIGNNYIDERPGYGCCFKMPNSSQTTLLNYKNVPVIGLHSNMFTNIGIAVKLFDRLPASIVDDGGDSFEFDEFINPGKSYLLLETYMGNFYVHSFKPNVFIGFPANKNPATGTKTICANEQFGVFAYPEGFPPEIYNWQYSLDNKATWRDVPEQFHKANPNFTMSDLLENNHLNYLGKTIYFRMGYNSMVFAGGIEFPLIYSACGPTVSEVSFEGPECYGDIVKSLSVTFNEELNSAVGEQLASISVVDINDNSKIFMQAAGPISYPNDTKKYTYTNFQQLENGHTYRIKYQAQITNPNDAANAIMRGFLYSPEEYDFVYTEPEPLTFKIKADNPTCHDGKVDITIEADGGTRPYYYDNLIGETEIVNGVSQIKRIQFDGSDINKKTVTIEQAELKEYNIKVTDANKCIEH